MPLQGRRMAAAGAGLPQPARSGAAFLQAGLHGTMHAGCAGRGGGATHRERALRQRPALQLQHLPQLRVGRLLLLRPACARARGCGACSILRTA
jgi:hypothetical protein